MFKDKPGGLVVDYNGIANGLKQALADYTRAKGRGRPTINAEKALDVLVERMKLLRGMLPGYDYAGLRTQA